MPYTYLSGNSRNTAAEPDNVEDDERPKGIHHELRYPKENVLCKKSLMSYEVKAYFSEQTVDSELNMGLLSRVTCLSS